MRTVLSKAELYTDGACLGNPGPGGYAALLRWQGSEKIVVGGADVTTNNRMELMAVIAGLKALKRSVAVDVYSDSKYVIDGIERYMHNWIKKGWRTSTGKPVKNKDLWESLSALVGQHEVAWHWVKGHSGHPENEKVDQLAQDQAYQFKEKNDE